MKKIGIEYYNVSDGEKKKIEREFIEEKEQCTEHFREQNDCEGFDALEKIAQKAGFEKLLIDPAYNRIHTEIVLGNKYVFYSENCVLNHQKLAETDKDFANETAGIVMLHEWEHHNNPSRDGNIKRVKKLVEKCKEEKEGNLSDEEIKEETVKMWERFFSIESQTNLQMITRNPDNFEDMIDALASMAVYARIVPQGLHSLEKKTLINNNIHKSFGDKEDKETLKKIIKREIEIQKDLIKKYNELAKSQGEEKGLLSDKDLTLG